MIKLMEVKLIQRLIVLFSIQRIQYLLLQEQQVKKIINKKKMLPFTADMYDDGSGFLEIDVSKYHMQGKFYANKIDENKTMLEYFKDRDNFLIIKSN